MERYHFNIRNGQDFADLEGTELPDLDEARAESAKILAQSLAETAREFWQTDRLEVNVTDGAGLALFSTRVIALDAPAVRRV